MSGFAADWLGLREPYDRRARNPDVLADVSQQFAARRSLTVVDLACGTGATRRAIAAQLPRPQHWLLVDNDLGLLGRALSMPSPEGCSARGVPIDLARDLEAALDGAPDLITTTALLDLVSEQWLERLVLECAVRRLPFYAALSYDGTVALTPTHGLDAAVIDAFNRHQSGDKGFGPALGPHMLETLHASCKAAGYSVRDGQSDWVVGAEDRALQHALLTAWARAAQETGTIATEHIAAWFQHRRDLVAAGASTMRVGHRDVFVRPIGTR